MRRFRAVLIATAASAALVAAGPSIGELRSWMRTAFPGWFGVAVNGLAAACLVSAIVAALARMRERRGLRLGLIVAALAVAAASAAAMASPSAAQNAVERFHFIQYGLVTWLWYRVMRMPPAPAADAATLVVPAMAALTVGAADEAVQWFVPERVGEYRDIFLNGTAILAGLLWSAGLDPPLPFSPRPSLRSRRSMAVAVVLAAAAIAAFVQLAQLGDVVRDDEIGVAFVSRYSGDELRALSAERAARWARQPPLEMHRYAREDQYLAEGLWHVRARNDAWERALETAWRENLILERYFAPVLDTPSYAAPISRWPPEQRRDADSRRGTAAERFVSHANPLAIHTFSPTVLWGAILTLSAVVTFLLRKA